MNVATELALDLGYDLALPTPLGRGNHGAKRVADHDAAVRNGGGIIAAKAEIDRKQPDLRTGPRDWCYLLENHGLHKNDFDAAERLITDCRKRGLLPLDIVSEDDTRAASNLEKIDRHGAEVDARFWVDHLSEAHLKYHPISFWENQEYYLEQVAEKMSVVSIFNPVCARYHVPIFPTRGSWDLHSRAGMLRRFAYWQAKGKHCVLQACCDLDVHGLRISKFLLDNLREMLPAMELIGVYVDLDAVTFERFGINKDFIAKNKLTWIEGLSTGGKNMPNLKDPDHPKHFEHDVQAYLRLYGPRKVEANALVRVPKAAQALCERAIRKYVDVRRMAEFERAEAEQQAKVEETIKLMLRKQWSGPSRGKVELDDRRSIRPMAALARRPDHGHEVQDSPCIGSHQPVLRGHRDRWPGPRAACCGIVLSALLAMAGLAFQRDSFLPDRTDSSIRRH